MNPMALGTTLAKRRREAGLSQVELARRMGTTQSAIARVEAGRALPTLPFLERLAEATGRPLELVIGERVRLPSATERRRRVQRALRGYEFNPWERGPTDVEARSLVADGLTREHFEGRRASGTRRR